MMMALSAAAHGQLVKCVSKDGKVEYARDCPVGSTEHQTGIRSSTGGGASASTATQQKSTAERDADFKKRQIEQQEAGQKDAKQSAEATQRKAACDSAQSYLRSLEGGMRITRTDPRTGERIFLDDPERAAEMTKARSRISENCKT
jgi:hypothetical protein